MDRRFGLALSCFGVLHCGSCLPFGVWLWHILFPAACCSWPSLCHILRLLVFALLDLSAFARLAVSLCSSPRPVGYPVLRGLSWRLPTKLCLWALFLSLWGVGEALTPGPEFTIGVANMNGLHNKAFGLADSPVDSWILSETHLTKGGIATFQSNLRPVEVALLCLYPWLPCCSEVHYLRNRPVVWGWSLVSLPVQALASLMA